MEKHLKEVDFQNPLIYQRSVTTNILRITLIGCNRSLISYLSGTVFLMMFLKNYLEVMLHDKGYVGYVEETKYGNILVNGVDNPLEVTTFQQVFKQVIVSSNLFHSLFIILEDTTSLMVVLSLKIKPDHNHMIGDLSSLATIRMYATRLAFIKTISDINLNTQKTPYFLTYDDDLLLEEVQRFTNVDGNSPCYHDKSGVK